MPNEPKTCNYCGGAGIIVIWAEEAESCDECKGTGRADRRSRPAPQESDPNRVAPRNQT